MPEDKMSEEELAERRDTRRGPVALREIAEIAGDPIPDGEAIDAERVVEVVRSMAHAEENDGKRIGHLLGKIDKIKAQLEEANSRTDKAKDRCSELAYALKMIAYLVAGIVPDHTKVFVPHEVVELVRDMVNVKKAEKADPTEYETEVKEMLRLLRKAKAPKDGSEDDEHPARYARRGVEDIIRERDCYATFWSRECTRRIDTCEELQRLKHDLAAAGQIGELAMSLVAVEKARQEEESKE